MVGNLVVVGSGVSTGFAAKALQDANITTRNERRIVLRQLPISPLLRASVVIPFMDTPAPDKP